MEDYNNVDSAGADLEKNDRKQSIEENFQELEKILKEMQSEEITLEQSFELYNQGVKLVAACNGQIDTIEKKIQILGENHGDE